MTKRRPIIRRLTRPLLILLALIFLFEAWLWQRLAPVVAFIVAWLPLAAFKAKVAAAIERLPPYPTLFVFIVPVLLLLPLKFLALWMLAHGYWIGAIAVLGIAKVVSLGVTAFIFEVTRPKLMQLAWFARFYAWVIRGLAWAHDLVAPVKRRVKTWLRVFSPKHAGRTLKLLWRLRRRVRSAVASPA